ncbi:MAG: cytidine deaminase [Alphaproteobacteria bacterium]|nr:cytidine deaminase [Alphaproteobacteria bacterium]
MAVKNEILQVAQECRLNAYAPYSEFKVGAAVLTVNNKVFVGCNVENASYPCGTCAEAGAISAMIAAGEHCIAEILIIADTKCILPCGNCLQKIAEFGNAETLIHSADLHGNIKTFTLQQLLPHNFDAGDMKC